MKKQKWIKIEKKDGTIIPVDYGWQSAMWCGKMILTEIKTGKTEEVNLNDIKQITHYTK